MTWFKEQAEKYGYIVVKGAFESVPLIEMTFESKPNVILQGFKYSSIVRFIAHDLCGPLLEDDDENKINLDSPAIPAYKDWHMDAPWEPANGVLMPCWRFAIYFRDYTNKSGCISFGPGTHRGKLNPLRIPMYAEHIQSQPGDLVIWNMRLLHAAGLPLLGDYPSGPRNAIFFDYATPGLDIEKYKQWRLKTSRKDKPCLSA